MKIVRLQAENFKRLVAVEITPGDNPTVVISGPNASGKTSVLDAIALALGGKKFAHDLVKPIREGQKNSEITVDTDTGLRITRRWTQNGTPGTLSVKSIDGTKSYTSPQALLDRVIGDLSFDPLSFAKIKPQEQRRILLDLIGVDVDEMDARKKALYDERTVVNRDIRHIESIIESIPVALQNLPKAEISTSDLTEKLNEAHKANNALELAKSETQQINDALDQLNRQIKITEKSLPDRIARLDSVLDERIIELQRMMDDERKRHGEAVKKANDDTRLELGRLKSELNKKSARLSELAKITDNQAVSDIESIEKELSSADSTNALIRKAGERSRHKTELAELTTKSNKLTEQMDAIESEKISALNKAQLPISGLGLDETGITYNGIPFQQSSASEQLRISTAIAMALNPEFRVIRITDASLLDRKSMDMLSELAGERDFQIWLEVVSDGDGVGFKIEDGQLEKS